MIRWPILAGASLMVVACAGSPNTGAGSEPPSLCSQLHRYVAQQQGQADTCGADVTQMRELTAVGNGFLLARRRFAQYDDLWQLTPQGLSYVSFQAQLDEKEGLEAFTLLPGLEPHVLVTNPRESKWFIYSVAPPPAEGYLVTPLSGDWPMTGWKSIHVQQPWGHEFIGLEDGNVLDRDLGDGSTRVWQVDLRSGPASPMLTLRADLAGGPRDAFTRGHNLLYLSPGRLLEWAVPASAKAPGVTATDCAGAPYAVWTYALDTRDTARDPFAAVPRTAGCWDDIGAGNDVLGDGQYLFVRERVTGVTRSYTVDPAYDNPLDPTLVIDTRKAGSPEAEALKSLDWIPPTRSTSIKRLVLVLQDGRSFDSYFGRYCTGTAGADGAPPSSEDGPGGCEAMPVSIAGAPGGCMALDAAPSYPPDATTTCMGQKIAGGAMTGFTIAPCGSPMDVVCAGVGADAGPVAPYHDLAQNGALADRMFQSFAYFTGTPPPTFLATDTENLLYLGNTHFNSDLFAVNNTPFLTTELGRLEVEWAFYAGTDNLSRIVSAPTAEPEFYDPLWYPYRSLPLGELERDIALGKLPYVSVVLPDAATDLDRGEGPGHSPANGIAFVNHLVETIVNSPYGEETLVLVTYLTAGGFFDHVRPPPALSGGIDATDETGTQAIPYGPRVPLLALGKFARKNKIAHEQLELSSLAVFIEWNWLHASVLKGSRQIGDVRSGRDAVVNNIGSLLDSSMTREPRVPIHHDD